MYLIELCWVRSRKIGLEYVSRWPIISESQDVP